MSTKIYEAYRVPISRLNEFIEFVDRAMFDRVIAHIRRAMGFIDCRGIDAEIKEKYPDADREKDPARYDRIHRYMIWEKVMEAAMANSEKMDRDFDYDFNCSVNIWINGRYAYAIPYGERPILEKIRYPKWVEDYAYWNNTDHPEHLTRQQWLARGRMWEKVALGNWNGRRLNHEVVSFRKPEHIPSKVRVESVLFPDRFKQRRLA